MEAFFPILLLILFVIIMARLSRAIEEEARKRHKEEIDGIKRELGHKDESCPPHRWSYHPETSRLTCTACGYVAGS